MVGMILASNGQDSDIQSMTRNNASSAAGNRLSTENLGRPKLDSMDLTP